MRKSVLLLTVLIFAMVLMAATFAFAATIERVSVDSSGLQANNSSSNTAISSDGRFVAFTSIATNLVPGDTNGVQDVFVHDNVTGETTRVSVSSSGVQSNGYSTSPSISADGRYVAFGSGASNLVPGAQHGIFVHDMLTGTTEFVSVNNYGANFFYSTGPSISCDGRYVAFESYTSVMKVYVRDRVAGTTEVVSVASDGLGHYAYSGYSGGASISCDGRYVAFNSVNLLVPEDTNGTSDVFVRDRLLGTTERVSVDSNGNQANSYSYPAIISGDGQHVVFISSATNLVPDDNNGLVDAFVHDMQTGITERVSVDSNGNQGYYPTGYFSINYDGSLVALASASNFVPEDTNGLLDVFMRDRLAGTTELVSVDENGNQGNGHSVLPVMSKDGRYVAITSLASNLVPGDTNGKADIFLYDRNPIPDTAEGAAAAIEEFLASGDIANAGVATSLTATLDSSILAQDNGNVYAAHNTILAFINQVQALPDRMISDDARELLLAAAYQILETLE